MNARQIAKAKTRAEVTYAIVGVLLASIIAVVAGVVANVAWNGGMIQ